MIDFSEESNRNSLDRKEMISPKHENDQTTNKHSPISDDTAIVLDTGSSGCRAGFANEDAPTFVTKFEEESSPIHFGHIVDNDKLIEEWMKALSHLELVYSEYPLMITTPTPISRRELEALVQNAFEVFKVPAMLPFDQSVLSLYSAGKWKAKFITLELLRDIKEKACRVLITPNCQNNGQKLEFTLPNGEVILMGEERYEGPEILFTPELLKQNPAPLSIQETVYLTMQKCDAENRKMLYENVVLTGGSSMFPNFGTRLRKCLEILSPSETKIKMDDTHAAGRYMAWVGGSMVASTNPKIPWITKQDYSEHGAAIVHKLDLMRKSQRFTGKEKNN
nr:hypothetical transcript [Hymenolepis microstoma]